MSYSETVNVNCFPVRDSKRFGGLISKIAVIAIVITIPTKNVTKTPAKIGADVNPMQSKALLNLVSPVDNNGCT